MRFTCVRALWCDEGETAQADVEMLAPDTVAPCFLTEHQSHFGAFVYEVRQERRGERDAALKASGKILRVRLAHHLCIECDGDAALVFGGELANGEATRARRRLPVDVTQIVLLLVVTQREKIVPRPASDGGEASGVHRQQVQFVADCLRLRIDDDVYVARAQPPAAAKETERETCGELESDDEHVAAPGKQLLDALLGCRTMRHVHKISERSFTDAHARLPPLLTNLTALTSRLDHDGEGGEQAFRVAQRDDHGRRLSRKDVIWKARRDDEFAQ